MKSRFSTLTVLAAAVMSLAVAQPVWADGHGWSHGGWGHRHGGHHGHWRGGAVVVYDAYPYWGWGRPFWGSVLGGIEGGILGSGIGGGAGRAAAIVGGAVIGSAVGGSIGQYMDDVDRLYVARTLEYSPSGRVTTWQNPDTLTRYEVAPVRTFQQADGRYCREYQTKALVGGEWQHLYGTACRQPDGSWQLVQ